MVPPNEVSWNAPNGLDLARQKRLLGDQLTLSTRGFEMAAQFEIGENRIDQRIAGG